MSSPSARTRGPTGAWQQSGGLAEYFDNPDLQGEPRLRRNEARAYFEMEMEPSEVVAAVGRDTYSIRWTATLTPVASGDYQLIGRKAAPR